MEIIKILDKGYVKYIGHMGNDESFIEAARMSTGKGFLGWYWEDDTYSDCMCENCKTHHLVATLPLDEDSLSVCTNCWESEITIFDHDENPPEPKLLGKKGEKRDLSLLEYLYSNGHATPFEMGDLCIEVKAPIMVFREWHRHRMQSYNEFSGRYSRMPNEHYLPELARIQKQSTTNKQGSGEGFNEWQATLLRNKLKHDQESVYETYDDLLDKGVAKEVARINTPVSRYSKMRAKTDIRNWLAFLSLRMEMGAQWEIRQYANAVASLVKQLFPKTFEIWLEHSFLGQRFSRTEMQLVRYLLAEVTPATAKVAAAGRDIRLSDKSIEALLKKISTNKEDLYKEVLGKL